jgi:16S rRNA G966 N2-methylase RsmD
VRDEEFDAASKEASEFLRRRVRTAEEPFDVIFFDPPYATDCEEILDYIGEHAAALLVEDGVVVVEHNKKKDLPGEFCGWRRYRVLKQGDSSLSFYRRTAA